VSQENKDKADAAESRTQQTKGFIQQVGRYIREFREEAVKLTTEEQLS
jgi:hypothetical protein